MHMNYHKVVNITFILYWYWSSHFQYPIWQYRCSAANHLISNVKYSRILIFKITMVFIVYDFLSSWLIIQFPTHSLILSHWQKHFATIESKWFFCNTILDLKVSKCCSWINLSLVLMIYVNFEVLRDNWLL